MAVRTGYRLGCLAVLAIVLLRLSIGWHFYSEGVKKYNDPNFSAEAFLLQAKGPLAPLIERQVPGFHRWREFLAISQPDVALFDDEKKRLAEWKVDFKKRVDEATKAKKPPPAELPPVAAYQPWGDEILRDWGEMLSQIDTAVNLDDKAQSEAATALRESSQELADYFVEQEPAITTYRHELYRLSQMNDSAAAGSLPYLGERIAAKRAEIRDTPNRWISDIRVIETPYIETLHRILGDKTKLSDEQHRAVKSAFTGNDKLPVVNEAVTWLTLGVGVLLLAGFFTRIASVAGALFLLSVIATQPPWVAGTIPIFNQVVEFLGLWVLFAVGAGRWAGLDFFSYAFWAKCCGGKEESLSL